MKKSLIEKHNNNQIKESEIKYIKVEPVSVLPIMLFINRQAVRVANRSILFQKWRYQNKNY